jgi:hypothetical protein
MTGVTHRLEDDNSLTATACINFSDYNSSN